MLSLLATTSVNYGCPCRFSISPQASSINRQSRIVGMSLWRTQSCHNAIRVSRRFAASRCQLEKAIKDYGCQFRHHSTLFPGEALFSRRHLCTGASSVAILTLNQGIILQSARAEDKEADNQEDDGIFGTVTSLFDPNEKTKSGKVLPKAYLKSARDVVKTLRQSLKEDPKDMAKFRRTADSAKESIRDYLNNWKGQQTVIKEESYVELEKAFRSLASFYAKAGPSASLTDDVKSEILHDLDAAEEFL